MPKIKAVIFDFDGTLFDLAIDWEAVKKAIGSTDGTVYRFLNSLPQEDRQKAIRIIKDFELKGVLQGRLLPVAREILNVLKDRKIFVAVTSRNSREIILNAFTRYQLHLPDLVVGLEDIKQMKPHPEAVGKVLRKFKLKPDQCLLVGDTANDMAMAQNAGIPHVLVINPKLKYQPIDQADRVINSLSELTF